MRVLGTNDHFLAFKRENHLHLPCFPMWCHQQSKTNLIVPDGTKDVVPAQTKKFMWPPNGVEKIYFEIAKKRKRKKCRFGLHNACKQENKTKSFEFILLLMFGISSECCKNENT